MYGYKKKKYDMKNGDFQTLCPGYDCTNEIMDIKEVSFTDQIRCYNTTKEVRSTYVTHIIVFESCTYSESMCWIDDADDSIPKVVRVCNKKPEGKCNLSLDSGRKGYSEGFEEWNAEIFMNPSICETIQGT